MVLKNKTKKPNDYAKKNGNKLGLAPFLHFIRLIRHQTSFFRTWHGAWSLSSLANIPPMASIMLLVLVFIHIKMHWNWYRNWFRKGLGSKSRTTALLSITFLLLALTGIILLGGACRRSIIGIWHFHSGWLMIVLAVVHVFKRRSLL